MKFSERLRQKLAENGKKQKHLAEEAGISAVTLSRWLNGRIPQKADFDKLSKVLGLPDNFYEEAVREEMAGVQEEDTVIYWKDRAEKAEARLRALTEAHPSDADLKEVSSDEYLARLREAMRFVFNFITQDSSPRT